jgi:hypothetical protein
MVQDFSLPEVVQKAIARHGIQNSQCKGVKELI